MEACWRLWGHSDMAWPPLASYVAASLAAGGLSRPTADAGPARARPPVRLLLPYLPRTTTATTTTTTCTCITLTHEHSHSCSQRPIGNFHIWYPLIPTMDNIAS